MTDLQRIVKYGALALAFSIIIGIVGFVLITLSFLFNSYNNRDDELIGTTKTEITEVVTKLDIELKMTNLTIVSADQFYIEKNNNKIEYKISDNILKVVDQSKNIFKNKNDNKLVVYIPKDIILNEISLDAGAGKVEILDLTTNELDLELGAGKVELNNIKVLDEASIDGGTGELTISDSILNNLNLDLGVGEFNFRGILLGKAELSCGVGATNIELTGSDYRIEVEKGLGTATINGTSISNNETYGMGKNKIEIDGGIGSINIIFDESEDINTKF